MCEINRYNYLCGHFEIYFDKCYHARRNGLRAQDCPNYDGVMFVRLYPFVCDACPDVIFPSP